jgi:RNA polymerase sigma-70 factor (ECF subfamily)
VEQLIREARDGEMESLGRLLRAYENYLRLLATTQIDRKLQARIGASDLVQETLMGAFRDFEQFRGHSERELIAWLRQILIHRLQVFVRQHVLAGKRDVRREVSLDQMQTSMRSSAVNQRAILADRAPSPSSFSIQREKARLLADAIARMSPQYRDVIVLRNLQGHSFDEVARRMNRTCGAVRMLWLRAIQELRRLSDWDSTAGHRRE